MAGNSSCLYGPKELDEALTNPAIVHFSEHAKSGLRGSENLDGDHFFHYLDQTAWSGWRPNVRDDARRASRRARAEIAWRVQRKRSGKPPGAEPGDDSA
jgi:hypothetical protein